MDWKKYKTAYFVVGIAVLLYLIHKLSVQWLGYKDTFSNFHHSLEVLYLFFGATSAMIMVVLSKVKEKNFDNVGMTFMLITSVKIVLSFLMVRPILNEVGALATTEKSNFFMLFILFLTIETVITTRILNNKQ